MIERKYKVYYNYGRMNGAERFFRTYAGAVRSAKSYIRSNIDMPENIYCEIECLMFINNKLAHRTYMGELDDTDI